MRVKEKTWRRAISAQLEGIKRKDGKTGKTKWEDILIGLKHGVREGEEGVIKKLDGKNKNLT